MDHWAKCYNPESDSNIILITSVIRQKGESQNGGNKKTKNAKYSEKTNISYTLPVRIRG